MVIGDKKNHIPGGTSRHGQQGRSTKQDLQKLQFWRDIIYPFSAAPSGDSVA